MTAQPTFTKNNGEIVDLAYARKRVWAKIRSDWGPRAYGYTIEELQRVMSRTVDNPKWVRGFNGVTVSSLSSSVTRNMIYNGVGA